MRTNPTQTLEHIVGLCGVSLGGKPQLSLSKQPSALEISYSDWAQLRHYGDLSRLDSSYWGSLKHLQMSAESAGGWPAPGYSTWVPLSLPLLALHQASPGSFLEGIRAQPRAEHAQTLSLCTGSFYHFQSMKTSQSEGGGMENLGVFLSLL